MGDNSETPMMDKYDPALLHVVGTLLGCREGDLLVQALDYAQIRDLSALVQPGIEFDPDMLSLPSPGKNKPIPKVPTHLIQRISAMNKIATQYFLDHGKLMEDADWELLTKPEFQLRIAALPKSQPSSQPVPDPSNSSTVATSARSSYTPADLFKKGIKCDPSAFPVLKQQKYYQSWKRAFVAQVHAQDVANVIDPAHNPTDSDGIQLFRLKQDYMYSVFQSIQ